MWLITVIASIGAAFGFEELDRGDVCFFSTPNECTALEDTIFDLTDEDLECEFRVEVHDCTYDGLEDECCCANAKVVKVRNNTEAFCDPLDIELDSPYREDPSSPWP